MHQLHYIAVLGWDYQTNVLTNITGNRTMKEEKKYNYRMMMRLFYGVNRYGEFLSKSTHESVVIESDALSFCL
jgi:hypothetical protein